MGSKCNAIHETIIRDVVDILTDIKDYDEVQFLLNRGRSFKSIAASAENLTLVFPLLATPTTSIQTASMVARALEKKFVTMLQMLFAAIQLGDDDVKDAFEYISKFHTNIKFDGMNIDNFIDTMDKLALGLESANLAKVDHEAIRLIKEDMKNINTFLPDAINEYRVGSNKRDTTISNRYIETITELTDEQIRNNQAAIDAALQRQQQEAKTINNNQSYDNSRTISNTKTINNNQSYDNSRTISNNQSYDNSKTTNNNQEYDNHKKIINKQKYKTKNVYGGGNGSKNKQSDSSQIRKNDAEFFSKQVLPGELKKANELMPTVMMVNFIIPGKDDGEYIRQTAVIGVKCKLYLVKSDDMVNRILLRNQDNHQLLKFIKATTREISFVRDFLFAIDKAKLDAFSQSKRGGSSSKMWKLLERRAVKSKVRRSLNMTNDASAITTLLINQEEVELIKKLNNIDIQDPKVIRPIMEKLNLIGVTIVDESLELCSFIFDTGDDMWESLSFTALERESSDNTYKRVMNVMAKMK